MTRITRRILFYCAFIVFLAASYVAVLYAQGYKYSFSENKFVHTGAIYVKANTTAQVLLDGKQVESTSLITNSASVDGLLPAAHILSVQKENHSLWQKKVTVRAGFVEEYSRILILPQAGPDEENLKKEITDLLYPAVASASPSPAVTKTPVPKKTASPSPSPTPDLSKPFYIDGGSLYVRTRDGAIHTKIAGDVVSAFLSPDGQKLAWFSNPPPGGQIWVYWFSDTNYQPLHIAGDIALIARFGNKIKTAQWFKDSDHIALDAGGLKITEIDTRPNVNIINF
ncbi:MAG: hypothetical protein UY20_C0001G0038 [Candidatus Yanofskybacteria bacterium GW2011_GWA1_48_10]|uniref:PEGA domain-containing protein n=2 Tax=Candidatus Yanofskyibacteriota TaxID=1752733 RepID=A0A0G1U7W1_9BACT|nr:MAG: hypothetical protein UY20_C0001G0038 [Candidatus Yanofskybacteria bacterium GW2011_GWA1_48_10]OGN06607.1 MAG: hypothetical protein A2669_03110 [Candidatus Yanofskybacteria bacterium RIFCSPHIGHO2_01_FULL_48_25b]